MLLPKPNSTSALNTAQPKDSILWKSGLYKDIYMNIAKSNLTIIAEELGKTIFTGTSRVNITGSHITFKGFQFIDGNIGTDHVISTTGSYNHFTELNIRGYLSHKYLEIKADCQYVTVSYSNFENRINLIDHNILSILVSKTKPGYNTIRYCSFKNFGGTGGDMGMEPIRIGLSTQHEFTSRSVVEYCYFARCDGDGEIISSKAKQNVFRYNTFEDNPKAELVLRHGDEGIVYGNFFLNGMGGVRIKEGQRHAVYNNYFSGLTENSINIQNHNANPVDSVLIAYNTFVNTAETMLGGVGDYKPKNVVFANNIFTRPSTKHFSDPTGTEKWIGNIAFGTLGIDKPDGIKISDPKLRSGKGFYQLSPGSPAINAAKPVYPVLPEYPGMDIDHEITYDLLKQKRPRETNLKDLGSIEYFKNITLRPIVNEGNTGPSYL